MHVKRWTVAISAAVLSLAIAAPATADPEDDKARNQRELAAATAQLELATDKAQAAAASYADAVASLPGAQSALAEAQGRVAAAEARVQRARREADAAKAVQTAADQQFAAAATKVDSAEANVARFAVGSYKGGGFVVIDSLMAAGSPNELAVRLGYLDQISSSHQHSVDQLTAARAEAREQRSIAAGANRKAQDAAAAADRALADSRAAVADAQRAQQRVEQLVVQREAAVKVAESEKATVLAKYNDLQAESARIAAEIRAAEARRGSGGGGTVAPPPAGSALFSMPVRGRKTSNYGRRFHPIFKTWLMHTGIDIAAPMGAPIFASGDGVVINAGWRNGYGNYTCISHGRYQGKGISTCYGHQSSIGVRTGQSVRRGQVIGRVGSTGNSTGPHVHFEVRLNGATTDPEPYLPSCLC